MNKKRQTAITNVILSAKSELEDLLIEEEDAMENVPESLTETDSYAKMESAIDFLNDAISQMDQLYDMWSEL
jgi:hypothetical protein